jgi:hypothetical protein
LGFIREHENNNLNQCNNNIYSGNITTEIRNGNKMNNFCKFVSNDVYREDLCKFYSYDIKSHENIENIKKIILYGNEYFKHSFNLKDFLELIA